MQDECSFVSLRDIERTMIVFEYFSKKMDEIDQIIDLKRIEAAEKAKQKVSSLVVYIALHFFFITARSAISGG